MLEGIISSLLNRYLSSLVHLDSEQLNVGVWSGRLHLTNLAIRPSLFASLPFSLRRGRIGSFLLQLNWAKMGSVPVQVTVDDVWLLVEARQATDVRSVGEWSETEVRQWMEQQKQRLLEDAFASASSLLAASGEAGSGFAATFIASIVDNVQIHVNRVHLCVEGPGRRKESYEEEEDDEEAADSGESEHSSQQSEEEKDTSESNDSSHLPTVTPASAASLSAPSTPTAGRPSLPSISSTVLVSHPNSPHPSVPRWSVGIVLHSLSIVTTDSGGHQTFVKSAGSVVYKRVAVSGLSVYWDCWRRTERRAYVDADSDDSFAAYMSQPFLSSEDAAEATEKRTSARTADDQQTSESVHARAPLLPALHYILLPTEATVRLELSKHTASSAGNETKKQPRISASVTVSSVSLQLNADQLRSISRATNQLSAALGPDVSQQLRHAPLISPALQPAAQADARAWWRFAIEAHVAKIRERREEQSWQRVLAARRDHDAYIPLYRAKLLTARDGKAEDDWRRQQREEIERRWPARTLLVWRSLVNQQTRISVAYNQVRQMNAKEQQRAHPRSYLYTPIATGATVAGWVGSFFYGGGGTASTEDDEERLPEMSVGERDQLSRLLGYDPMGPIEQLASAQDRDAPLYRVEMEVTQIALTLYQPAIRPITAHIPSDELGSPQLSAFPHTSPAHARSRLDLAMLTISTLRAAAFIQAAETTVQLEVGGLDVEDCMQRDSPQFRYLVTSDSRNVQQVTTLADDSTGELGREVKEDLSPAHSTSLIKVLYTHHDYSKQTGDNVEDGAAVVMEVEEMGVFTRTVSVPALPSTLLSVSDSVDLQFNTMHVNWNRTTISLLVQFLTAEEDEEDEDEEEEIGGPLDEADAAAAEEQKQANEKQIKDVLRNRRRTMPPAAVSALPSPMQARRPSSLHVRTRSTPVLPAAPQPLAAADRSSSSSSRLHPSDPRPLLRALRSKLTNVSRYRQAREAAESETVGIGRAGSSVRKLQLSSNKQRRQSDEAQLAREESASLLPRPAHEDTGKRELRYVQFRLNASMQSFSVCLNDELADVTLTQAEVTGLNLSLDQSQPDTGLRADSELDNSSSMKQQTLQVRGTVGGITVYDTHSFTSAHPYSPSPQSPQSAGHRPSSINPAHFGASSVLSLVPPRAATRVFFKHRSSDLALLTFSFTMQPQPVQHHLNHHFLDSTSHDDHRSTSKPVHRGYDASLNLRLSSISAVISHDFFGPLIAYASEGLLKQATDKAAQQARKAIDTIKEDLESRSYLFKYVVAVDNPLVFFPHTAGTTVSSQRRASWSPDSFASSPRRQSPIHHAPQQQQTETDQNGASAEYLVLDLGRISVYNDFFMSDAEHSLIIPSTAAQSQSNPLPLVTRAPMERINLSLAAVNLLRASRAALPIAAVGGPSSHLSSSSSSSVLPPAPLSAPAAHFSRRSASHDTLHELRADFSVYGDGLPIQPVPHVSSSSVDSTAAAALSDAGHFWRTAVKRKLLEDMDIQVRLVTPLGELRYIGLSAKAVEGDISTVHINVNEHIYAFLLSMYVHDFAPLLALADKPSTTVSTSQPPVALFDGASSVMEEQWGTEQDEQHPAVSKPLSSIAEEKSEANVRPASAASASSVDDISVNLSFREIFIDVQLSPDCTGASHVQRSSSPYGNVHAAESASSLSHFFFLDPASAASPAPFAHVRASTLHIIARLQLDSSTASTVGSEFQCSVAKLSVQDSRAECAHPLFRQIIGGHKDDVSLSTAARNRRRSTHTILSTPATSSAGPSSSSSSTVLTSPLLHPQALSVDWSSVSPYASGHAASPAPPPSRPFPSQFLLTPVIPKSPTRSPLPVYHRLSASLQSHSLHTPLPPTILPDLVISGRQDGSGEMSVDVEFTAPRLVLSPGCLTAILHLSDVMDDITDRILAAANSQPAGWEDMSRSASASTASFHTADQAHSKAHRSTQAPLAASAATASPPVPPLSAAAPAAVAGAAMPVKVHVAIRDPQIWLMADAAEHDGSASHLTHSSTQLQHSAAQPITVVEPASRRRLHLPEWQGEKSPGTAELTSDDDMDEREEGDEDEEDEQVDDEKEVKARPSRSPAVPKSLSCIVIRGQVEVNATIVGDNVQASVDMTELQALICYRAHHLRLARLALPPVPIFEPIHLNIDYSAQLDPDAIKGSVPPPLPIEHILISLSSLDACFSFLQISTAASILHAIVRVLPPEMIFSSHTPIPSAADPSVLIVPPTFKGSMQLQTAGIELAIVNDAPGYYVPLMKFELSPVALSYTEGMPPAPSAAAVKRQATEPVLIRQPSSRFSWPFSSSSSAAASSPSPSAAAPAPASSTASTSSSGMSVSLKATIAGSVYNSDIQRWEVFFDPWSIQVSGDDSDIAVTSSDMFAVTVTPSCIHTLVRGVDSFQTHFLPTITALLASSDDDVNTSVDEIDRSATPPRGSSAYSSPSVSRKASLLSPTAVDRHQPPASNPSADKASYFIVRNETGMRLQFWSVQDGGGAASGSRLREREKQAQTLESGEERTVEMRQYIGVGSGGSNTGGRRWLYRSPALGLCVEAGNNSGRWDGWRPIEHISLAAAEETSTKPPVAALLSLNEDRKSDESVAGLTVHRLVASRGEGSETPSHQRQLSTDTSSLLASLSSLTSPTASTHDLSLLVPPTPSSAVDSVMDTWLACRLVAGSDAEGSSAKVLVVSSTLLAFNRTFLDLDLQLFDTAKGQATFTTLLASGQSVSLPVLYVPSKQMRLRVRPSGGAGAGPGRQWQWCDNGPRLSYVKQKAYRHTTVRCTVEAGDGSEQQRQADKHHRFYARVNVFRSTPSPVTNVDNFSSVSPAYSAPFTSSPTADDGVYTIVFDPPLAYKNMLGCELDYMLVVKHKPTSVAAHSLDLTALQPAATYTGTLPHKQEVHWYALDLGVTSACTVQLSIRRSLALSAQPLPPSSVTSVVGESSRFLTDNDQRLLSPFHHSWSTEWSPHVVIHSTIRAPHCRVQPSVPLKDRHGQILDVALDYSDLSNSPVDSARIYPFAGAGPGLVTSFVPYWLFNCTGLPLVYGNVIKYDTEMCAGQSEDEIERRAAVLREKEDALHADATAEHWFTMAVSHVGGVSYTGWHPSLRQKPYEQQPFLLSDEQIAMRFVGDNDDESVKDKNRRASIRLPNTDWSKPFSVDAVGTHGAIEVEEKLPSSHPARPCRMYEFGVSVSLHPNIRFHRTKTILIHPRVLLLNATTLPLQYRQVGTNECVSVSVFEQVAVHRFDSNKKGRLSLRIHAYGWQWSARHYGVAVDEVGSRCMRVRNTSTQQVAVLRLDTRLVQATFEVTVSMAWQDEQHDQLGHHAAAREDVISSSQLVGRTVSAPFFDHQPDSSTPSTPSPASPISPVYLHPKPAAPLPSSGLLNRSATVMQSPPEQGQRQMYGSPEDVPARSRLAASAPGSDNVPYRLENRSQHTLVYYQADEEYLSARIQPHSTVLYAWDEPDGSKELIIAVVDAITLMEEAGIGYGYESNRKRSKPRVIGRFSLDRIVKYPPVVLPPDRQDGQEKQLTVNVFADGRVRVLRLSDSAASMEAVASDEGASSLSLSVGIRLAGLSLSLVSHAMPAAGGSTGLVLHRDTVSHELYHVLDASVARAGRLDPPISRQELIYLQVSSVEVRVRQSKERLGVDAAVGSIQIDNQLHSAVFPVIFCPVVMKKDMGSSSSSSSFLAVSVVKSLDKSRDDVLFLPHLSIRLQKMQLNVEEQLVSHLLHFATLVTPAFTSSPSSSTSAAITSSKLSARTVLSSSTTHANSHVSSDLAVSSSQLLTAQRQKAKRAGKTGVAASGSYAGSNSRHVDSFRRDWDSSDRVSDLRARQHSSADPASALQLSGSVRRRTTLRPSSSSSSLTSLPSVQQLRLAAPPSDPLVLCLQELTIYPIQINVSYSASAALSSDTAFSPHSHPLRFLLRALNVTILNIDAAPLRLSSLHLYDVFSSPSQLADRIRWHFLLQLSTGFYSLLGSSDLLGNPVGLFTSISSGLQSFFYEPVAGLTESPQAFSLGVIRGTVGLIQHSLYGVTNTTRGIMSSLAKGLTSLSQSSSVGSSSSSSRSAARRRERQSLAQSSGTSSSSYMALRLLWSLHSSTVGLVSHTARTGLSFVSSAVDLVSSTADSISHAVNPQAKATRIRPPALFELGLIDRRRLITEIDTRAMDSFIEQYLREHANQLYYCYVTSEPAKSAEPATSKAAKMRSKDTVVSLVLLSTRLLVLYSRPTASSSSSAPPAPVLMHDLSLSDLVSVRQSSNELQSTTLWYEQPVQGAGSVADKHTVQQVSLSLALPSHLLQLLHAVMSVNQAQQQMNE